MLVQMRFLNGWLCSLYRSLQPQSSGRAVGRWAPVGSGSHRPCMSYSAFGRIFKSSLASIQIGTQPTQRSPLPAVPEPFHRVPRGRELKGTFVFRFTSASKFAQSGLRSADGDFARLFCLQPSALAERRKSMGLGPEAPLESKAKKLAISSAGTLPVATGSCFPNGSLLPRRIPRAVILSVHAQCDRLRPSRILVASISRERSSFRAYSENTHLTRVFEATQLIPDHHNPTTHAALTTEVRSSILSSLTNGPTEA